MSSIPSSLARVPSRLASQVTLGSLIRANQGLLQTQVQLSSGQRVNRSSDDAIATSAITTLDDVIEKREQRQRNLSHAEAVLGVLDQSLGEVSDLLLEAKQIGVAEASTITDPETRRNQALVIESLLNDAVSVANRRFQDIYLFAGASSAREPVTELLNGLRYTGEGSGLRTDLGPGDAAPITVNADDAFGALSARVEGEFDLDPLTTLDTRIDHLNGARGMGVTLGAVNVTVGATQITVDLTDAYTVGDVAAMLQTAIDPLDPGSVVVAMDAGGDGLAIFGHSLFDITISDVDAPGPAADLGLAKTFPAGASTAGDDLDARVTRETLIASLPSVTSPLGSITIENAGQTRTIDLSGATTVEDVIERIEAENIGIRVEVATSGDRLNFINELSGGKMSIGEVTGGSDTATELGVRTMSLLTSLDQFNDGRGVDIVSGSVDPVSGAPDPSRDIDFRITTKDGTELDIDLAGALTVGDVIAAINSASAGAGIFANFQAGLATGGNGITLTDTTAGSGDTIVAKRNGSSAAEDLGILGSESGAILTGEDRAKVAVESLFTHLMDLATALRANDTRGIQFAAQRLDTDIVRTAETRALVGVRSQRVAAAAIREEELLVQDTAMRSQFRDLDYAQASVRFAGLQQQLEAGLAAASRANSLSLLNFLR